MTSTQGCVASSLEVENSVVRGIADTARGCCWYTRADFIRIRRTVAGADLVLSRRLMGFGSSNGSVAQIPLFIMLSSL